MNNKSRALTHRAEFLLVVLCILPVLVVNFGYRVIVGIDHYWKVADREQIAHQELESMSAGSDFSYQLARISGNFARKFKSVVEADLKPKQLQEYVEKHSQSEFCSPFPEFDLFTFQILESQKKAELLTSRTSSLLSKRAMEKVFGHLVKVNRRDQIPGIINRQNDRIVSQILGGESKSDVMAKTQRGKSSFSFYKKLPHWFFWDYFEVPGRGTFGFFVFSRNDENSKIAAKKLALRDLRDRNQEGLGAFIPILGGFGGKVMQSPLHRSGLFRKWADSHIVSVENDLRLWLEKGVPRTQELGKYLVYSYLGKGHTHLAVFLLPLVRPPPMPTWLFLLNLICSGAIVMLLLRGMILGVWPSLKLKARFVATYLLAATLPVGLLLIGAYAYITQYRKAEAFKAVSSLQSCIKQFDARKEQVHNDYRKAFAEIIKDPGLAEILAEEGSQSQRAHDRLLNFFMERSEPLPLFCFAFIDENGQGKRYYADGHRADADPAIDTFSYPISMLIRRKIQENDPAAVFGKLQYSTIQETSLEAYRAIAKNDLILEMDKRRSFPITRNIGNKIATQIHDLIKIDGVERFSIFVVWDDQALDEKIFKTSAQHFSISHSNFSFIAYKVTPKGLDFLHKPDRHADSEFISRSKSLAEQVSFRGSYISSHFDNLSIVAMPSKKYANTIITGGSRHFLLEQSVTKRISLLLGIAVLSILLVLFASFISTRIILDPITKLKTSLERVAAGRLNINIASQSQDETGQLCREFSTMVVGLREREKLASLISAQAVEAISSADSIDKALSEAEFEGVALVSDIRNFTGLCENYSPHEMTSLLNEHFAQMAKIISDNGGRIYKFIGDAIEAVFPEEADGEKAGFRAFNAASQMLVKLMQINRKRVKARKFEYKIGIGLAYGKMFSGSVGSADSRLDFAIIGEPLQAASALESMSIANPVFPLVVDGAISGMLKDRGIVFAPVENSSFYDGFILQELGDQSVIVEEKPQTQSMLKKAREAEATVVNTIVSGMEMMFSRGLSFVLGAFFVFLIAAGIIFGMQVSHDAAFNSLKVEASSENLRYLEQIKSEAALKNAFESSCFSIVSGLENLFDAGQLNPASLPAEIDKALLSISPEHGRPSKYAVYGVSHKDDADLDAMVDLLTSKGWANRHLQALSNEASKNLSYVSDSEDSEDSEDLEDLEDSEDSEDSEDLEDSEDSEDLYLKEALGEILGEHVSSGMLNLEFFGRASEIVPEEESGFFYWDFILDKSSPPVTEKTWGKDGLKIIGVVFLFRDLETLKGSKSLLLDGFATEKKALALVDSAGQASYSSNFPDNLKRKILEVEDFADWREAIVNPAAISFGGKEYRIFVVHLLDNYPDALSPEKMILLIALIIGVLVFWGMTLRGMTVVNRSLSAKLWLSFIFVSVIPLFTVYYVYGLFWVEDYSVRVFQERVNTQREIDMFELRESFSEPIAWKFVKDRTFSEEFKQAVKKMNESPSEKNLAEIEAFLRAWHKEYLNLDRSLFNFFLRDIAISGVGNWSMVAAGPTADEDGMFGMMLKEISRSLIKSREQNAVSGKVNPADVQGEIAVETGLHTVKSLFGDDIYVRLAYNLGNPVMMHVFSGTGGLIIHIFPDAVKPEFVIVWMVSFAFENYLAKIASLYDGKYKVLPVETHRVGKVWRGRYIDKRHELVRRASWISTGNLPISGRIKINDEWHFIEGRPGVAQLTSLIMAMVPESSVLEPLRRITLSFSILLVFSIVLIVIIAKSITEDILLPIRALTTGMKQVVRENYSYRIRLERVDELGNLCQSFDLMMKGLEEKQLMGRMLSKSARKFSLEDSAESGCKAEFVLLFVGIPNFSGWATGAAIGSLFEDLRTQISIVSRILMDCGGDVDKIIGEKVLAVFSIENGRNETAALAAKAAEKLIEAETRGLLPFPVAIGAHMGEVITGFLGIGEKRDFTVIGDAVNVSARIESHAEKMRYHRCLLSESLVDCLSDRSQTREYGEIELKGKSQPVKVYQLTI